MLLFSIKQPVYYAIAHYTMLILFYNIALQCPQFIMFYSIQGPTVAPYVLLPNAKGPSAPYYGTLGLLAVPKDINDGLLGLLIITFQNTRLFTRIPWAPTIPK